MMDFGLSLPSFSSLLPLDPLLPPDSFSRLPLLLISPPLLSLRLLPLDSSIVLLLALQRLPPLQTHVLVKKQRQQQ